MGTLWGVTVVIAGPTAAGKSALAVALAHRYQASGRAAEVVNADSMLVYRGMDIGTAKPTEAERAGVTHHLIDILDVGQTATVADFQQRARAQIADCRARAAVPILVGGSALYLRAILDDFRFPGTDPEVRAELETELARLGSAALHAELTRLDPVAAARMEPNNGRRVVRALEVIRLTGGPYDASLPAWEYLLADVLQIGLRLDRPTLDARIGLRVERMWASGVRRGGARAECARSPGGRDGLPGPGLPPDPALSGRRTLRGSGPRADGVRNPSVRPAAGLLVPP